MSRVVIEDVVVPPEAPRSDLLDDRKRKLWTLHDFGSGRGLEIGPLHNTTVPKALGDVYYVDVFDRETLVRNYADEPNVRTELIDDVDFVLVDAAGRPRSISEAAAPAAPYDWVMASHVVEHIPDLVGWLDSVAEIVVDRGHLVLAVPDRRYCFDIHRPATTVGQLLHAHDMGDTRPSVRAVYDYYRNYAIVDSGDLWSGVYPGYDQRRFTLDEALDAVRRTRSGEYVDAHVWAFTPSSFVEQLVELRHLGCASWQITRIDPTPSGLHEFYVVLERVPREVDASLLEATEVETSHIDDRPDWLRSDERHRARTADLEQQLARVRASNQRLRERLEVKQSVVTALRRRDRERAKEVKRARRLMAESRKQVAELQAYKSAVESSRMVRIVRGLRRRLRDASSRLRH